MILKQRACMSIVAIWLAVWIHVATAAEPVSYKNHRLLKVNVVDPAQLDAIEQTGAIILNCIPGPGTMDVVASQAQMATLHDRGLQFEVRHENVQDLIDAGQQPQAIGAGDPYDDFFLDYHQYDNGVGSIVWFMNELVARYPGLVSIINVGTTVEGRTIWGLRIANDAVDGNKPGVFYFSCVHAREWVTTTVPTYFARHILEQYGSDVHLTDMVDKLEIFLVPVANVDGYEFTWSDDRLWRKNRTLNINGSFGVDINRNWGEAWGYDDDGSSPNPNSQTYRGTAPFSEPETVALRDFFLSHPNIRAMLDIHSFSQLILWPWGYIPDPITDQALYEQVGFAMRDLIFGVHGEVYTAGPIHSTIYPVNGGSCDWTYAQLRVLSFSYELRPVEGPFGSGFELPPAQIIPNNEEILPAMLHLTNTDFVRSPVIIETISQIPEVLTPGQDTLIGLTVTSNYENLIPGTVRMHYRYDPAGPFNEIIPANVGGDTYEALLPATNCSSVPEFYFSANGDGGSVSTLPHPAGLAPFAPPVAQGVFYEQNMDVDPGWTTQGQWQWGVPTGGGGLNGDPTSGYTGDNVYGYNLTGNYTDNLPATYLTTEPIDCTGRFDVQLRFQRWLVVESNFNFDEATVQVSNNGTIWTTVFSAGGTGNLINDGAWTYQQFDISAIADDQPTVYIRWGMGPTDSSYNLPGWNIDDVQLFSAGCEALAGDWNGDAIVDLADYAAFAACVQGPLGGIAPTCAIFDFNADTTVDLIDFAAFQRLPGN